MIGANYISCCNSSPVINHLLFHFFHANVFHLLANTIVMYKLCQLNRFTARSFFTSLVIATLCSFVVLPKETVGLSGILMAMIAQFIKLGKSKRMIIILLITYFLPHFSTTFHLACFSLSYLYRIFINYNPLKNIKLNAVNSPRTRKRE